MPRSIFQAFRIGNVFAHHLHAAANTENVGSSFPFRFRAQGRFHTAFPQSTQVRCCTLTAGQDNQGRIPQFIRTLRRTHAYPRFRQQGIQIRKIAQVRQVNKNHIKFILRRFCPRVPLSSARLAAQDAPGPVRHGILFRQKQFFHPGHHAEKRFTRQGCHRVQGRRQQRGVSAKLVEQQSVHHVPFPCFHQRQRTYQ